MPEPALALPRPRETTTHTQVPGVQLHLLLQLRQQLVVEGLELRAERENAVPWRGRANAAGERGCTDRAGADGGEGQTDAHKGAQRGRSGWPSRPDPLQLSKPTSEGLVSPRQDTEKHFAWLRHRQRPQAGGEPGTPGWGTHHLLQLVLDLPVDFCHLEEHVSCKDKTWGESLRC